MTATVGAPELRTERLLMRRWRDADRAPFAAMNADPAVMERLPKPLTTAESDAFADDIEERLDAQGFGLWAIEVVGGAPFIGYVGLHPADFDAPFTPAVEVGWRLSVDAWGHGFATEAAQEALRFGFEEAHIDGEPLDEIVSFTSEGHRRSRAVMERLGMHRDPAEDFDHPRLEPGHTLRRHVLYRLRAGEWRAANAGSPSSMRR